MVVSEETARISTGVSVQELATLRLVQPRASVGATFRSSGTTFLTFWAND
jgi:hypothetical protein